MGQHLLHLSQGWKALWSCNGCPCSLQTSVWSPRPTPWSCENTIGEDSGGFRSTAGAQKPGLSPSQAQPKHSMWLLHPPLALQVFSCTYPAVTKPFHCTMSLRNGHLQSRTSGREGRSRKLLLQAFLKGKVTTWLQSTSQQREEHTGNAVV